MLNKFKRFFVLAFMFLPCFLLFTACGEPANTLTYATAFNKTGIPNLNRGTVESYVINNNGSTQVVLTGLSNGEIENYKSKLVNSEGFNVTVDETTPNTWARQNYIDNHLGDKIILTTEKQNNDTYKLTIYFESYFAMLEEPKTVQSTNLTNLVDSINNQGSVYYSCYQSFDVDQLYPSDSYPNSKLESLSLFKEVAVVNNPNSEADFYINYTYTAKEKDSSNVTSCSLRIVFDHNLSTSTQMTYLYDFGETRLYAQGSKANYANDISPTAIPMPNTLLGILDLVTYNSNNLTNENVGSGKIMYKSNLCDLETYKINDVECPYVFRNGRLTACNINGVLTEISLTTSYNETMLNSSTNGYSMAEGASTLTSGFFSRTFLSSIINPDTE